MESKELNRLIELISRSNFKTFEMEREGFRLRLVKEDRSGTSAPAAENRTPVPAIEVVAEPSAVPAQVAAQAEDGNVDLKSPIVGTFYSAAGPDSPPFVESGTRIKKGQVVCIVEAMKVMNEIEAEIDAEVVDVLVDNGQPVEFGEVLFRLRAL